MITKNSKEALSSFFDFLSKYYLSRKLAITWPLHVHDILEFLLETIKKTQQLEHYFHNFCDCCLVYSSEKFWNQFIIPSYNFTTEDFIRTIEDESVANLRRRLNSSRRSRPQANATQIKGDGTQEETGLLYPIAITNVHGVMLVSI